MARDYGVKSNSVTPISAHTGFEKTAGTRASSQVSGLDMSAPEPPSDLGDLAKKHWVHIAQQLENAGLISCVDISVMRVYVDSYELYLLAQSDVAEKGEYQTTSTGYEQLAPWAIARDRHATRLHKLEGKLFLTPHARKSINLDMPDEEDLDI